MADSSVPDLNDDMKLKKSTNSDYGTSSRDLKSADEKTEPAEFLSCRCILYTMMFLGFAVAYTLRVSLNEAIVAMVNQTAVGEDTVITNVTDQCPRDSQLQHGNGEFIWNRSQQGIVLAAFYYGYILTQVCTTKKLHVVTLSHDRRIAVGLFTTV